MTIIGATVFPIFLLQSFSYNIFGVLVWIWKREQAHRDLLDRVRLYTDSNGTRYTKKELEGGDYPRKNDGIRMKYIQQPNNLLTLVNA